MALPDSLVSISAAVHARVFFRRAEQALKTTPSLGCLSDIGALSGPRFIPAAAGFRRHDGELQFVLTLDGKAVTWLFGVPLPVDLALDVYVAISAETVGDRRLTVELVFAYSGFDVFTVDDDGRRQPLELDDAQSADVDQMLSDSLDQVLGELTVPLALTPLVASDRSVDHDPALTLSSAEAGETADTLLIGVEVESDDNADRSYFRNTYAPSSLGERDWTVEVDARLFTETVQEHFDSLELEGEVDGWADTDEVRAFWSEAPVPGDDYGQTPEINAVADDHPIWAIIEGDFTVFSGLGELAGSVELGSWAVVFADLAVEDGDIVAIPGVLSAGYGIVRIAVPEEPLDPVEVTSATLGDQLRVEGFDFDKDRLALLGTDDHAGLPGEPLLDVPEMVKVELTWHVIGSGLCTGLTALGEITENGDAILSRPRFGNVGSAPLWMCGAEIEDDTAGVFSVVGPTFPLRINPGQTRRLAVAMAAADGDSATYTATLRLRINEMARAFVFVPISGHREPRPSLGPIVPGVCIEKPEHLPPPEWFEDLWEWLTDPREVFDDPPAPDDLLLIAVMGLPAEAVLVATDRAGIRVDTAAGGDHRLVLPSEGSTVRLLGADQGALKSVSGAWVRTASWHPVGDWRTDEKIVAYTVRESNVAVLTPKKLALVPLGRDGAREVPLTGGIDIVTSDGGYFVLTDSELLLITDGQVQDRAAMRGATQLRAVRGGVLALGDGIVSIAELHRGRIELHSRSMRGRFRGAVPTHGGLAIVSDRDALLIERPGARGLEAAKEVRVDTLGEHVGDWLKASAPDPARVAANRQIRVVDADRRGAVVATLGPSKARLKPPPSKLTS